MALTKERLLKHDLLFRYSWLCQKSGVDKRVVSQKGGFGGCPPPPKENRNEGTFGCSPGTKTGTRVRSHVPSERKSERGHIRQNHPFTKPPFCLPVKLGRQKVGYGMVVDGIAKFPALKFTFQGLKFPEISLFCWLEGESLRNFRP